MPIRYSVDAPNRAVYLTAEGLAHHRDFADVIDALASDPDVGPEMKLLCDYSRLEFDLPTEEIEDLSEQMRRLSPAFDRCQVALISSGDLEYGLMRMFSMISSEAQFETRVFRSIDEAREWLGLPTAGAGREL